MLGRLKSKLLYAGFCGRTKRQGCIIEEDDTHCPCGAGMQQVATDKRITGLRGYIPTAPLDEGITSYCFYNTYGAAHIFRISSKCAGKRYAKYQDQYARKNHSFIRAGVASMS